MIGSARSRERGLLGRSVPRASAMSAPSALLSLVPRRNGDENLLRESIRHCSPSQLDALRRDRRRWVRRSVEAENDRRAREAADEVVCREGLRMMVKSFVESWRSERPSVGGRFAGTGNHRDRSPVTFVSAFQWLASESGVSVHAIENIARPTARSSVVAFHVADALVSALGQPEAWHDGTLERTTRSSASCCSGSETASR